MLFEYWDRLKRSVHAADYRRKNPGQPVFECPGCGYVGPFEESGSEAGQREHAQCPRCGILERHRLQLLVLKDVLQDRDCLRMKSLHFAPEAMLRDLLARRFGLYLTADLSRDGVDLRADLLDLPFADRTYDFIFASHVLEHIPDDHRAISEICRVLKPGGVAILPVPVVVDKTVEYAEPNPNESFHVRAPGLDYFNRYKPFFSRVELYSSDDLDKKYQLYIHERRCGGSAGNRQALDDRHPDFVPVCYK